MVSEDTMGRNKEHYAKWRKETLVQLVLKLNRNNDGDIIEHLNAQPNKRAYLIELIREDMRTEVTCVCSPRATEYPNAHTF